MACSLWYLGSCWAWEWSPDLDAYLYNPAGFEIAYSICPAGATNGPCGDDRQETIALTVSDPGMYRLDVVPYDGEPNYGAGGSFSVDIARGPTELPGMRWPHDDGPAGTVHVADLDATAVREGRTWGASVAVSLIAPDGTAGIVTGTWTHDGQTGWCVLTDGGCKVTRDGLSARLDATSFEVGSVAATAGGRLLTYDPALNADPDGDSDGTTIEIVGR